MIYADSSSKHLIGGFGFFVDMVNKNSRKDSLIIYRNNMFLEQVIATVNLQMAEREKYAIADLNPELTANVEGLKAKIIHIQKFIDLVDNMLKKEEEKIN